MLNIPSEKKIPSEKLPWEGKIENISQTEIP
jgi:hypothetical protein